MRLLLIKISSIFFLTVILASNVVNLHVYWHDQIEALNHCDNDACDDDGNQNDSDTPCDLCLIAYNLNNLDYNNTPEFSFENLLLIQQPIQKETFGYIELFHKKLYLSSNRNKAPPHLV